MVYISLDEILPTAHMFGEEHLVIIGATAGMIVMALSIYLIL
jgi:ZIP family zinc transporter